VISTYMLFEVLSKEETAKRSKKRAAERLKRMKANPDQTEYKAYLARRTVNRQKSRKKLGKEYINAQQRVYSKTHRDNVHSPANAKSRQDAKNEGKPWSISDKIALYSNPANIKKLSKKIGRSFDSISMKGKREGISMVQDKKPSPAFLVPKHAAPRERPKAIKRTFIIRKAGKQIKRFKK